MEHHNPANCSMRRLGNRNAAKAPLWVGYELDSKEAVEKFLVDTLRMTWTGKLGTRQTSAINGTTRLLMECRGYILKSNLVVQPKKDARQDSPDLEKIIDSLPLESKQKVIEKWREELARKLDARGSGESSDTGKKRPAVSCTT